MVEVTVIVDGAVVGVMGLAAASTVVVKGSHNNAANNRERNVRAILCIMNLLSCLCFVRAFLHQDYKDNVQRVLILNIFCRADYFPAQASLSVLIVPFYLARNLHINHMKLAVQV